MKASFRFLDDALNRRLLSVLKSKQVRYSVDREGLVSYSERDEELLDELISSIRTQVFAQWQVLTCPREWVSVFEDYMTNHDIPYEREWANGELWFLIPSKFRPHAWKLEKTSGRSAS